MADQTNPIPRVTRDDPAAHSGDVVGENIAALKALFPTIVTDGKVDFDVLRQLLGDVVDDGAERYGLNWKGKAMARAFALTPSLGTLRPAKADSVDWDTTKNIVIEGDNLEVLKLLRKSYAGKIKLIYIDPPYNTGKDFVYPDNYVESLSNYLALTGQRGEDGARLTSNKEASGRFHTDWLNMMYPRLMLAKELLRDDGAIFVTIDDAEVDNLRKIMSDVFGDENFVANVIWQKKYAVSADEKGIASMHDHVIVFRRSPTFERGLLPRTDEQDRRYTNLDNDLRGNWASDNYVSNKSKEERPTLWYEIKHPKDGRKVWPEPHAVWRYSKDKHDELDADNRLYWGPNLSYERPRMKRFLSEVQQGLVPSTWWPFGEVGHNDEAQKSVGDLLGRKIFSTPKPVRLLDRILTIGCGENDIVLDFFAGSGSTAHAVMEKNAVEGGSRRFIMVQLPEPLELTNKDQAPAAEFCDKLGKPRNIAELTKERLRRAGAKVKADNPDVEVDTGFRVYKLNSSNLKPWQPGSDLQADLLDATSNVLPGRSEDDLLVELLLKTGIDLALPSEARKITGRAVHVFGGGTLVVCLADIPAGEARALAEGIAEWLAQITPPDKTTFFFKDSGFDAGGNRAAEARSNLAATLRQRLGDEAIEKLGAI